MNISYDLAKKLKDAGFPPPERHDNLETWTLRDTHGAAYIMMVSEKGWTTPVIRLFPGYTYHRDSFVYIPTLSELIESCKLDGKFLSIDQTETGWEAYLQTEDYRPVGSVGRGPAPEEAVAHLYLALHPLSTETKETKKV